MHSVEKIAGQISSTSKTARTEKAVKQRSAHMLNYVDIIIICA
jgi:hypothetical protein